MLEGKSYAANWNMCLPFTSSWNPNGVTPISRMFRDTEAHNVINHNTTVWGKFALTRSVHVVWKFVEQRGTCLINGCDVGLTAGSAELQSWNSKIQLLSTLKPPTRNRSKSGGKFLTRLYNYTVIEQSKGELYPLSMPEVTLFKTWDSPRLSIINVILRSDSFLGLPFQSSLTLTVLLCMVTASRRSKNLPKIYFSMNFRSLKTIGKKKFTN